MTSNADVIIIGGGAAGFFTAINIAERNPKLQILLLERSSKVLTKVKISGGGRCNVTHAEFLPRPLTQNYPRGEKELLGPFHTFMTGDTIQWFEEKGVPLVIEEDGRIFPKTNSSQTIIDCFLKEVDRLGITILKNHPVKKIDKRNNTWNIFTEEAVFKSDKLIIATGSNTKVWKLLGDLGHNIIRPVPSLFTFNIDDERIKNLPGIATPVSIVVISNKINKTLESEGPLLITHRGLSGPAVLKLSAWGANELCIENYQFRIKINWLFDISTEDAFEQLKRIRKENSKQAVTTYAQFSLPKRLWRSMVTASGISVSQTWAATPNKQLQELCNQLTQAIFQVQGKSTFKEEFVTAGGVDLKEINFKRYESKLYKDLYFAGEVLNIDAITGGFNFQNAWTGGYIIAKHIFS